MILLFCKTLNVSPEGRQRNSHKCFYIQSAVMRCVWLEYVKQTQPHAGEQSEKEECFRSPFRCFSTWPQPNRSFLKVSYSVNLKPYR